MPKFTVGWAYEGSIEIEAANQEEAEGQFDAMDHGAYLAEIATTDPALVIQFVDNEYD